MKSNQPNHSGLLRLGGIAGICAGLCILTFAISSEIKGTLFVNEALSGGSINAWIQNVISNPDFVKYIMILPILGFSFMLVLGYVLYQLIGVSSWQKNLSLVGYIIGVPVVVSAFVAHVSLINQLIQQTTPSAEISTQIEVYTSFAFHRWMVINDYIGPFFIIIVGHSLMGWAAYKANVLPKWMAYWAVFNGSILLINFLHPIFPALAILGLGGPLSMLWLVVCGTILLRKVRIA
ncbi:DUF4386 family protein [Aureisphaera sp. CAU 1614]|uniref:DUF4386 family protein n=1 Tax=Halomarinibacterium sedimenti TaxID=2857106 RepID=A0A9X1JW29_9FLAO|nr:DUF4386 family protein [Halomarinibacterium sedimenti]MBW2938420.1 DUF4386 family protein [Halomarinibacterium sedimenti]